MSETEDGGPAFPTKGPPHKVITAHGEHYEDENHGMSLRDYFAGQVVGALGSALNTVEGSKLLIQASSEHDASPANLIAVTAYQIADAMLSARKAKP